MYNRTLKIALFGLDDAAVNAIKAIEAPERCTFEFSCDDHVDLDRARSCAFVVATAASLGDVSLAQLSEAARESVIGYQELALVATSGEVAEMGASDFELIDAVWPSPLSPECAAFEFAHVVERVASQADHYMVATYLDTIIDSMPAMVWFKALDGEHVKVNSYFCEIVDKDRSDVEGQFHNYIWNVPPEDWEKAELTCKESDNKAIEAGKTVRCDEYVSTHGEIRLFDTYKSPVFDEDGTVLGTSGFAHDVTLERELQRLAWVNARTDYLTGLYNRRYFYEYLDDHADEGPMTYVLIDLDNFKSINDGDGHAQGDQALLLTSEALREGFPDCPVVRWGGDEFIVVVPRAAADLASDESVEAFQRMLSEKTGQVCSFPLTASIGIAEQGEGMSVDLAVKHADEALYKAKADGKARHERYA